MAYATFFGPDHQGTIYYQDPRGMRQPMFNVQTSKSKPNVQMHRILPNGHMVPFSTASWSSMSGSVKVSVEGSPEIKMELSYAKGTPDLEFKTPAGHKLRWKYGGWGNTRELHDDRTKSLIATYKVSSGDSSQLDILVQDTNQFVDMVIALAVSVGMNDRKDDKQLGRMGKIVGALAG
jgi:hypothetical protein